MATKSKVPPADAVYRTSGRQSLVPSPLNDLIGDPPVYGDWCLTAELTVVKVAVTIVGEIGSVDEPSSCEFSYALT